MLYIHTQTHTVYRGGGVYVVSDFRTDTQTQKTLVSGVAPPHSNSIHPSGSEIPRHSSTSSIFTPPSSLTSGRCLVPPSAVSSAPCCASFNESTWISLSTAVTEARRCLFALPVIYGFLSCRLWLADPHLSETFIIISTIIITTDLFLFDLQDTIQCWMSW